MQKQEDTEYSLDELINIINDKQVIHSDPIVDDLNSQVCNGNENNCGNYVKNSYKYLPPIEHQGFGKNNYNQPYIRTSKTIPSAKSIRNSGQVVPYKPNTLVFKPWSGAIPH